VAVIGGAVDAPALIVPVLNKVHIPWISGVPADPSELTSPNAIGVSGGPASNMAGYAMYAKAHGLKAFTFLSSASPAAQALAETIGKTAFAADNIKFKIVLHPFTAVDLTSYMTEANEGNPGAIAVNTLVPDCISAVRAAQQLAISATILLGNSCETADFFTGAGSAWTKSDVVSGPYGRAPGDPDTKIYNAAMAKYAPTSPINGYAPAGFAAVMDFDAAVTAAHPSSITAATVLAAMKAAKGVHAFLTLGSTLNCTGTLVPKYPDLCATTAYYYKVNGSMITPVAQYNAVSVLNSVTGS
jgi:branched-chain amino acid transport system substrate-binding protein